MFKRVDIRLDNAELTSSQVGSKMKFIHSILDAVLKGPGLLQIRFMNGQFANTGKCCTVIVLFIL